MLPERTTLAKLRERLKWAYEGSAALNGRIDWNEVHKIRDEIKEFKQRGKDAAQAFRDAGYDCGDPY